ncbi:MAG TPA: hypothetical protein VMX75_11760 [Spirochaetia bacterium]|nr:hypothetical protein [Spirochaetia bacterium]
MTSNPFKALAIYPASWIVAAAVLIMHLVFAWWFPPGLLIQVLLVSLDVILIVLWFVLAFNSGDFKNFFDRIPYRQTMGELRQVLPRCADEFKEPALECLKLIKGINKEFADKSSLLKINLLEIDSLLVNLLSVAEANRDLSSRLRDFGTDEQQSRMHKLFSRQIATVSNSRDTLRAFSGNLTLFAADTGEADEAVQKLKYANEGMQEVMKESKDEKENL